MDDVDISLGLGGSLPIFYVLPLHTVSPLACAGHGGRVIREELAARCIKFDYIHLKGNRKGGIEYYNARTEEELVSVS